MRVLWITSRILRPALEHLGKADTVGGSWMMAALESIHSCDPDIHFGVAAPYPGSEMMNFSVDDIDYYLFPFNGQLHKCDERLICEIRKIYDSFKPDLVHVHGTEHPYGLALLSVCPKERIVFSIQGLISEIAKYYRSGLSLKDILSNVTFRDIVRFDSILGQQRKFRARGENELEILRRCVNVIGRTSWDKAHSLAANKDIEYYFCNETLRSEFYTGSWEYGKCTPHTIFLSQSYYPVKGLHILLKALVVVRKEFPDVKVRCGGEDFMNLDSIPKRIRRGGYAKYLCGFIKKNNLEYVISSVGTLSAAQMKEEYLRANVFVCPSTIENSSNSICEAQILGVPVIASFVGGTPDLMRGQESMMYRYDDAEMLARLIIDTFRRTDKIDLNDMQETARQRHSQESNCHQLMDIYKQILTEK